MKFLKGLGRFCLRIVAIIMVFSGFFLTLATAVAIPLANNYANMVSMALGQKAYEISGGGNPQYFTSDYDSLEDLFKEEAITSLKVEQEAITLLQNTNETLPLNNGLKISLFGAASVEPVYSGAGAGSIDTSKAGTLKDSLEKAGFKVNETLWNFYDTGAASSFRREMPNDRGQGNMAAHDAPVDLYTDDIRASFSEYGDAAIVVVGRSGSESSDLPEEYLEFTKEEQDMIALANENFDKVILLLNVTNAMNMTYPLSADLDAILWVGAYGQEGIDAVGQVLNGEVNPSGHLVDTWTFDPFSSPAAINQGDYTIANSTVTAGDKYIVYEEGIYVGYRYYETRFEDVSLGQGNAGNFDYDKVVAYPFGYGLSYTEFAWSDYELLDKGDSLFATITVKNTGSVAGRDTVQLYAKAPYTDYDITNHIEKAAVELCGFKKTKLLNPGEEETLRIEIPKSRFASYDAYGKGTYILEDGLYFVSAAKNAHDAVIDSMEAKAKLEKASAQGETNTITDLTACFQQSEFDAKTYAVSKTGANIENQFSDCDILTYDDKVVYLSRSDWQGTWPTTYADGSWQAPDAVLQGLELKDFASEGSDMPTFDAIDESVGKLTLSDMIGLAYDDPKWDTLMNQMSMDEMWDLISHGGYGTKAIPSIGLPGVTHKDGPAGISNTLAGGTQECMGYPPAVVLASTWDDELAYLRGAMVGEDSIQSGIAVWYAPAMNIHRTARSGRNFEYYSEDALLSGVMGSNEVAGFQSKGGIVTIKHFAINDQETNRIGGAMFFNEQSARELYLVPFEMCVEEADATGLMDSMNRVGVTWSGGHEGLVNNVLRKEWGYNGFIITDQASFGSFSYSDIYEGLQAGTDMWLCTAKNMWNLDDAHKNPAVLNAARNSAHRYLYVIANSNAMNGVDKDTVVKNTKAGWQKLIPFVVVVILLIDVFNWFAVPRLWNSKVKRMEKKEKKLAKKAAKKAAKNK